ncbi:MAG: DUF952 domain-containing protein [Pseudomonadota bacterium]
MDRSVVYKILNVADWEHAVAAGVSATALDSKDGYVHLSTAHQVGETLALHYGAQAGLHLLEFAVEDLGDVRWEPSRGGELFPHLYGALQIEKAKRKWVLDLGSDNVPSLPVDL